MTLSIDPSELKGYYESLDTEEIISILASGGLEPEAEPIARQELKGRGVSVKATPVPSGGEADPIDGEQFARRLWRSGLVWIFLLAGAVWTMLMGKLVLGSMGTGIGFILTALFIGAGWLASRVVAKSICASKTASHLSKTVTLWSLLAGMCATYLAASFILFHR